MKGSQSTSPFLRSARAKTHDEACVPPTAITLEFTYPPSANRIWRNYRGVTVKSDEYKAWIGLNAARTLQRKFREITGRFRVTILAAAPDKRRRDIDNLLKPTMDLLQIIHAISDDSNCRDLRIAWVEAAGAGVNVTVEPL